MEQTARIVTMNNQHFTILTRNPEAVAEWYGTIAAAVWPGGLAWVNADGVKLHTIDTSTLSADRPEIGGTSPAGRWLTFTLSNGDARDLYVADVLVGSYQLLRQDVTSFQFAPDGRTLLVKPNPVSSNGAVAFLFPMGGGSPLALKNSGVELDGEVVWSPDGSQIAVIAQADDFSYVDLFQRSGQFLTGFLIPLIDLDAKTLTWYPNCTP